MKITLIVALSMGLIHPQSEKFNVINGNPSEIVQSTSFWLSGSPIINPTTNNRMIFQISSSSLSRIDNSDIYRYPNIDIGLKVTKNLALTYKSYGFKSGLDRQTSLATFKILLPISGCI